jgi:hypothetical protein
MSKKLLSKRPISEKKKDNKTYLDDINNRFFTGQVCLKKHINTLSMARVLMPSKHAGIVLTFYCMSIAIIELGLLLQVHTAIKL